MPAQANTILRYPGFLSLWPELWEKNFQFWRDGSRHFFSGRASLESLILYWNHIGCAVAGFLRH